MKNVAATIAFALTGFVACAQQKSENHYIDTGKHIVRICVPPKGRLLKPPLYVFRSRNRKFVGSGDSVTMNVINPKWIESITVLKDKSATAHYGDAGKNGVIDIALKSEGYDTLRQLLKDGKLKEVE